MRSTRVQLRRNWSFLPSSLSRVLLPAIVILALALAGHAGPDDGAKKLPPELLDPLNELDKALQEFRVQMSGESNGKSGSKPGGRQNVLSGRLFEYFRNDALDAVPHEVRQRGGEKSLLRRNQFGFNLTGPVVVPGVIDGRGRTFFSVSYEGTRERIAQSSLFTVPTDSQRRGDFSDLIDNAGRPVKIYDPATTRTNPDFDPSRPVSAENPRFLRDAFAGNIIPLNRIDPVAWRLVQMYPAPNIAIGPFLRNNYWINSPFENQANGILARIDHSATSKHQLTVTLNYSRGLRKSAEYFPGPANSGGASSRFRSSSLYVHDSYTQSANTVWQLRAGAWNETSRSLALDDLETDHPGELGIRGLRSTIFPSFQFGGFLPLGPRPGSFFSSSHYAYEASFSASLKREKHTFRFSGSGRRRFINTFSPSAPAGRFFFDGTLTGVPGITNTGSAFADFLLGEVVRLEQSLVLHPSYWRKYIFDFSVGDEYRVRSGLTLDYGLGLRISTPRIEKYDRQSTVDVNSINPANGRPGALIFAGRDGVGRAFQPTTVRAEPVVGLALNPWNDRRTVVRLGFRLLYQDYPLYGGHFGTRGFNSSPLLLSPNAQLESAFKLAGGVPQTFTPPPLLDPAAANGNDIDFVNRSGLLPSTRRWNVAIQRELPFSLWYEVQYIGARGKDQFVDRLVRINAIPVEHLRFRERLDDEEFRDSLRPFPQYRNFNLAGVFPAGVTRLDEMIMSLDKRLSGGLYGRVSYRLAKQLENITSDGAQDPANLAGEMALAVWDVTHIFEFRYTYELPFGKGRAFFNRGELIGRVLGGWSVSGISSIYGGVPLQFRPLFNRTGGVVSSLRVNAVSGVDPRVSNPSAVKWFNPEAFVQPDDFAIGNLSRTHPRLRGPREQYHHLSVSRNVQIGTDRSIEFLAEAFNFPNLGNLNYPDTFIGSRMAPNLNAGRIIGSRGGRVMQLGIRILF